MEKDDPSPGASQGGTAKVDASGQEKQPTGSVRLDQRADEPTDIYVIYPQDVTVKSQADAINEILDRVVVHKATIYASEVNAYNMWTLFWNAALSESQANKIREDPNVGSIQKSNGSYDPFMSVPNPIPHRLPKRNEGLLRQRHAANEMKFISQPLEVPRSLQFRRLCV
ncbi:hypothetical protein XPA_005501 [Xanthoria parietina]